MNLRPSKFFEPQANHVSCFANASGGEALRPPPKPSSSQVECLNIFPGSQTFFPGLVGMETIFFSRGCNFFPGPTQILASHLLAMPRKTSFSFVPLLGFVRFQGLRSCNAYCLQCIFCGPGCRPQRPRANVSQVNCTDELLAIPNLFEALKRRFSGSHVRLLVLVDHQDRPLRKATCY